MTKIRKIKFITIILIIFSLISCNIKKGNELLKDTKYIYVYPYASICMLFPLDLAIKEYNTCIDLMEKGKFYEASQLLKNVLKIQEQDFPNFSIEKAKILTAMGICDNALYKNQIAELRLRQAQQIIFDEIGIESIESAISSNNLAGVLMSQKKMGEALSEFSDAIVRIQSSSKFREIDLVSIEINKALVLVGMQKDEEGITIFKQSLKSINENFNNENLVLAFLKDSYAFADRHNLIFYNSNKYFDDALRDFEKYADEKHPYISAILISKGFINDEYGNYNKALEYYNQALELQETSLCRNPAIVEQIYINLGLCYDGINDYEKSEFFCNKALEIAYQFEELRWDISTIYNNLGALYAKRGNFKVAQNYFLKSYFNIYGDPYSLQSQELYKKNIQIIYEEDGGEADQFEVWLKEQKDKEEFQPYSYASSSSTS